MFFVLFVWDWTGLALFFGVGLVFSCFCFFDADDFGTFCFLIVGVCFCWIVFWLEPFLVWLFWLDRFLCLLFLVGCFWFLLESLILAQDERWRRA